MDTEVVVALQAPLPGCRAVTDTTKDGEITVGIGEHDRVVEGMAMQERRLVPGSSPCPRVEIVGLFGVGVHTLLIDLAS